MLLIRVDFMAYYMRWCIYLIKHYLRSAQDKSYKCGSADRIMF